MNLVILLFFTVASTTSFAFADLKSELYAKIKRGQISLSYNDARVKLFNNIYLEKDADGYFVKDVYCSAKYYHYKLNETPGVKLPDPRSINTEHTWPQSKFNAAENSGFQKSDLHHLYPTYSKINSERGNLPYADVNPDGAISCNRSERGKPVINGSGTYFEPPVSQKGNVARSMFYFSIRYKLAIDPVQEFFFRQWHVLDPITEEDKKRHEIIATIQKNRNPFIDEPELVNQILDF